MANGVSLAGQTLANVNAGTAIPTYTYAALGGTGTYTYAIASGTLPSGITLNTSNGQLTGTSTVAGTYTFTVQADDYIIVLLDHETPVYIGNTGISEGEEKTVDIAVKNGIHTITMIVTNVKGPGGGAIDIKDGLIVRTAS